MATLVPARVVALLETGTVGTASPLKKGKLSRLHFQVLGNRVRLRFPVDVITTRSSIRTPTSSGIVKPGLNRDEVTRFQRLLAAGTETCRFVDFQSDARTSSMKESLIRPFRKPVSYPFRLKSSRTGRWTSCPSMTSQPRPECLELLHRYPVLLHFGVQQSPLNLKQGRGTAG
jgi:hypothetical protein